MLTGHTALGRKNDGKEEKGNKVIGGQVIKY
jgi:hypothetical protein